MADNTNLMIGQGIAKTGNIFNKYKQQDMQMQFQQSALNMSVGMLEIKQQELTMLSHQSAEDLKQNLANIKKLGKFEAVIKNKADTGITSSKEETDTYNKIADNNYSYEMRKLTAKSDLANKQSQIRQMDIQRRLNKHLAYASMVSSVATTYLGAMK